MYHRDIPDTKHNLEALRFCSRDDLLRCIASIGGVSSNDLCYTLESVQVFLVVLLGFAAIVRIGVAHGKTKGAGGRDCQWTGNEGR